MRILSYKDKPGACIFSEVQKVSDELILNRQTGLINIKAFYEMIISTKYYEAHLPVRLEEYLEKNKNKNKQEALIFEKSEINKRVIKPSMAESVIKLAVKISDDYVLMEMESGDDQNRKIDLKYAKKDNNNVAIVQVKTGKSPLQFHSLSLVTEKVIQENKFGRTAEYLKVEFSEDDGSGNLKVLSITHLNEISGGTISSAKFYSPDGNDSRTKEEMKKVLYSVYESQLVKNIESGKKEISTNFF